MTGEGRTPVRVGFIRSGRVLPVWQGDRDDLGRAAGTPMEEVSALVEQLHRRARAVYGDRAGELAVVRLGEDATGTLLRPTSES